ncbi:MAG: fimbrillin family protein [Tannerellaceae bacterium]|jgi:hypothetical protein|nr:fimbrillin family protein [Tannerellaceae bacterium]
MDRKTRSKITGIAWVAIAFAWLLNLVSCSDDKILTDDTAPYAVVSFRVQGASPSTRAGSTGTGQVNAVIVNGRTTSGARGEVLLEGGTLYRLKGTENHFDYSPHVYFPSWAEYASFSAYSPASSRIGSESFTVSPKDSPLDNIISYSVPDPSGKDPQEDLLVAAIENKEVLAGPVVLNMRHALSRVHVRARNMMVYPVIIEKLSLHNLHNSGKLKIDGKINDDDYATDDYKVLWTPLTEKPDGKLSWALAKTGAVIPATQVIEQVTADDQAMLVMPQTTKNENNDAVATGDDFYLEVTYTVQNYGSNTVCSAFRDVNGLDGGLTFEMGRQYALTITFTADEVTFNVSVDGWDKPEVPVPF